MLINHANPSWPNWVTESAVSGCKGPQKSWRNNIRVRVRALTVMDIETRVRTRLPRGEVTERCEDQGEGKGPRRYGPCSLCVCFTVGEVWPSGHHFPPRFLICSSNGSIEIYNFALTSIKLIYIQTFVVDYIKLQYSY
jgi:hypothetical protein